MPGFQEKNSPAFSVLEVAVSAKNPPLFKDAEFAIMEEQGNSSYTLIQ